MIINTSEKIIDIDKLPEVVSHLKKQGKKIVTTNGAFDILHVDHKVVLERSRALGDILIVGVNSDRSVKQYKSEDRPIIPDDERAQLIAALACVDYVTIFHEPDPIKFLQIVKPSIHTKGGDYDPDKLIETKTVRENGGEVVAIPHPVIRTTSSIIEKILKIRGQARLYRYKECDLQYFLHQCLYWEWPEIHLGYFVILYFR